MAFSTLADLVVKSSLTDKTIPHAISDALRLPAQNHAPLALRQYAPMVERFVFGEFNGNDIPLRDLDGTADYECAINLPLDEFWIEYTNACKEETARVGGFKIAEKNEIAVFFQQGRDTTLAFICEFEVLKDRIAVEAILGTASNEDIPEEIKKAAIITQQIAANLLFLASTISSHHTTHTRRQILDKPDFATRRMLHRRLQTGLPWLSANIVEMRQPTTCYYRGELRDVSSFAGKRGHLVIGHWRFINNQIEPYWTWVDGHERGSKALGWVQKTRLIPAQKTNRTPAHPGKKGERIPFHQPS